MSIKEKLKATRTAIHNIWFEHYFTFDPGTPIKPKVKEHKTHG